MLRDSLNRRHFIKRGGGLLALLSINLASAQIKPGTSSSTFKTPPLVAGLTNDSAYKWLAVLGMTQYRCADIGECLLIRQVLEQNDPQAAVNAYATLATRLEQVGRASLAAGHRISARDTLLRAATYFFASTYYVDAAQQPQNFRPLWERHRACFDTAASLFNPVVEQVRIPFEGTSLPGYFLRPNSTSQRRPTLILNNGSDGSVLDMWTNGGASAIERGYNILIFDGPGQGAALWRQGLYFRPNWETVVTPVVDYLLTRPDVDPRRIALQGISQGGYWVPRALAFESRIAAGIADPGVTDVSNNAEATIPAELTQLLNAGQKDLFDRYMTQGVAESPKTAALLAFRMRPYGVTSYYDFFKQMQSYSLNGIAEKIRCPLLITDPAAEQFFPGQSKQLYDQVKGPKQLVGFSAQDGSDLHCEVQALAIRNQRVFDWLDSLFFK
ncbi:S9 family peptidase [Deinococcus sp. Leaf326]|uniref:alpha/beta hydrolase family protein n=1 Tax=Deinococcus sp. Leaf326 TaxID=1736338 RepID=UPI000B227931|nr:prolyl oligopeptidase family serine peptidase [Deinococcus sp. Leaf326]